MKSYRILIVEDDNAIRRGMTDVLKKFYGPDITAAATGTEGCKAALESEFDLILLDWMLPGMDGIEILQKIQTERPGVPVIMLTAKGTEKDRVAGLKLGADDYVVKPFSVKELLARIEAVLRRSPGRSVNCDSFRLPGGTADLNGRKIRFDDGVETPLTEREFDLLAYLARHPGRVVARDEILQRVWNVDPRSVETRTIDMTIARLRDKIRDKKCEIIQTVRSRGYQFSQLS
jgi:DNA-binding response OmpR family regulator